MSAAIYYQPEAYTTSGPKLMGRNAAGESFLRGFLAYSQATEFWVQVQTLAHARHFAATAQAQGRPESVKGVDKTNLAALANVGVVYHPGPGIGVHAWQRGAAAPALPAASGHAAWSLCGITHTTSSAVAMDALADLLIAPVQLWDAVICTSTAVRHNVDRLLQAQAEHLQQRLGASRIVLPQLPVIPLGIHTQDFVFTTGTRAKARHLLAADGKTHVVLYMGRLSFHAKAHPLAMYQALEMAAQRLPGDERLVLVECGWHANVQIARAYADAARQVCPSVRVVTLDGRVPAQRETAWAGADIFCSLSDNIQETFGIVPIEAMAAGLPVVVADWDGYKDTVRDGVDGFRVPVLMPGAGMGADLALRHALEVDSYDMYCGHTCSLVAVDVAAAAAAFTRLLASVPLRQQMGAAGRQRACQVYDWKPIIGQYESLWASLSQLRQTLGHTVKPLAHPWPARLDPFYAFASYPTEVLGAQTRVALVDADLSAALARVQHYSALAMVNFASLVHPSQSEVQALLQALQAGPKAAVDLLAGVPQPRQAQVFRSLAWLLKLGVLKRVADGVLLP